MRDKIRLPARLMATVVIATVVTASSEIFTSSLKIRRMVEEEESLLGQLKEYIEVQYKRLKKFAEFSSDRLLYLRSRKHVDIDLDHPNSVYNVIKTYTTIYFTLLGNYFPTFHALVLNSSRSFLVGKIDLKGGRSSLLRLQKIYGLVASDMVRGDYLGYQGPQLKPLDAYRIGQTAFSESNLNESLDWLNVSLTLYGQQEPRPIDNKTRAHPTTGALKAIMGRVHLYNKNEKLAKELYEEARQSDLLADDVKELGKELQFKPTFHSIDDDDLFVKFSRLCRLEKGIYPPEQKIGTRPLFCRNRRESVVLYCRYKEEILAHSPFISVIYNFVTDGEGDQMKRLLKQKTSEITNKPQNTERGVALVYSEDSPVVANISKRIEYIFGQDRTNTYSHQKLSSDPMQVSHFGVGADFDFDKEETAEEELRARYGDVRATFLIYLNDVRRGGATVFPNLGISVSPIKNMALVWSDIISAHKKDHVTSHSSCPVLIGQKWTLTKWIRS